MFLTFILSVPFVLLGSLTESQLLPGLPAAALMFVCPALAALVLSYGEGGAAGVSGLLVRSVQRGSNSSLIWFVPVVILMPVVAVLAFAILRLEGVQVPNPQFSMSTALGLFGVFFVSGLAEELGWSGYALDPLQDRFGALKAGLLLGVVWAVWHLVALVQAHREISWMAWWSLGTVAARVITVWLYNNTGRSVFAAALFHTTQNVTWQLFPINGSHYDPRVNGLILASIALLVAATWCPRTLTSRRRRGRGH